jgi:hypothetical protein
MIEYCKLSVQSSDTIVEREIVVGEIFLLFSVLFNSCKPIFFNKNTNEFLEILQDN